MMQVLVSVNSVAEAELVLSAGVPLIDLKDTSHGALAALDIDTSKSIVMGVRSHLQRLDSQGLIVSATIGDSCNSIIHLMELIEQRLQIGVDVIKLPETIWSDSLFQPVIEKHLKDGAKLIAVFTPESLMLSSLELRLQNLAQQGYWGVMVDTVLKSSSVLEMVNLPVLAEFVKVAKSFELIVGIAGGLSLMNIDSLSTLDVDYLGFRSGVCAQGIRAHALIAEQVDQLVSIVNGTLLVNSPQTQ